jgi:stringent starvation protein B
MNFQEGIGKPFAPWRRGLDGLVFDAHGIMLNVTPMSTKYLSLGNLSIRKINPAFPGKCMAVAVAVACASVAAF